MSYLTLFLNYNGFDFQQTLSAYYVRNDLASEYKPADILSITVLFFSYVQMFLGLSENFIQFFHIEEFQHCQWTFFRR